MLLDMVDGFPQCQYFGGALPTIIVEPAEIGRAMRQIEVLSQF
jgi:hypothetical protein